MTVGGWKAFIWGVLFSGRLRPEGQIMDGMGYGYNRDTSRSCIGFGKGFCTFFILCMVLDGVGWIGKMVKGGKFFLDVIRGIAVYKGPVAYRPVGYRLSMLTCHQCSFDIYHLGFSTCQYEMPLLTIYQIESRATLILWM